MIRPALPRPKLLPLLAPLALAALLAGCNATAPATSGESAAARSDTERVGRHAGGRSVTPVNQVVTPLGRVVELPGRHDQLIPPEQAADLLLEIAGRTREDDVWILAETADAKPRIMQHMIEERRRVRHLSG